jgi:hypothetical protein
MSQELQEKPAPYNLLVLIEIKKLCGPPPVLSSENVKACDFHKDQVYERRLEREPCVVGFPRYRELRDSAIAPGIPPAIQANP